MMPEMNGYEVCKYLKEHDRTKDIPVIFISAKSEVTDETMGFSFGAVDYITKPFVLPVLMARIRTHLELQRNKKELIRTNNDLKNTQAQMLHREKMASLGELAAGVAHEINNPMGFISSNLGSLRKYVNKFIGFIDFQSEILNSLGAEDQIIKVRKKQKIDFMIEDTNDLLDESLDGARRVTEIVQNLKGFSQLDEALIKETDIHKCLDVTLKIIWNELKHTCTIHKKYGELPLTICNAQELNQAFMNLLINASHAIEEQGDITIRTWEENNSINVAITDTGGGIPQDKIDRIFEPFFTTKDVGKGTGLGLSICYDIIKKHNGGISVESEYGKGTTFTIILPVKKNEMFIKQGNAI